MMLRSSTVRMSSTEMKTASLASGLPPPGPSSGRSDVPAGIVDQDVDLLETILDLADDAVDGSGSVRSPWTISTSESDSAATASATLASESASPNARVDVGVVP